jgi:hypothetical protein
MHSDIVHTRVTHHQIGAIGMNEGQSNKVGKTGDIVDSLASS